MKPNPYLKNVAVIAAIIGTLVVMFGKRLGEDSPARHSRANDSGPIVEETRQRANSVPVEAAGVELSREPATRRADFDFYLLALSVHRAFCADGHGGKPECRAGQPRPLVIHGLWPEKLAARAYPRDCPAAPLDLEPALARDLAAYMPGMRSGLHQHEWRTHGGCSGLDDDEYFRRALELARHLDVALRAELTTRAGGEAAAADLRAAADRLEAGLGASLTFHCRTLRGGSRPHLMEVRQCLDDDGAHGGPGTPLDCARVNRRDQGCGSSFLIAGDR